MNDTQARSYHGSDANYINFSGQRINLIKEKHKEFSQFSLIFTPKSLRDLIQVYDEACNITSDNAYVDIQAKATENVKLDLEVCCKFFQRCKFDIEMAFPNDKKMWDQFGFNDYDEARRSGKYMYLFLTDMHMIATRNSEPLTKVGWSEENFAQILILRDKLKKSMNIQSDSIMDRSRATENRMLVLNNLHEKMSLYFKAARIIFDGNEEILKWFKFPAPAPASIKPEEKIEGEIVVEE